LLLWLGILSATNILSSSLKMENKIFLSVIVPAYNEEARIGKTLDDLRERLGQAKRPYEIIIVNDGSTDRTAEVVLSHTWGNPNLKLIQYKKNRGKGYAVKRGMMTAQGENRLFMDADNSVSIDNFGRFYSFLEQGFDLVIASIEMPGAQVEEQNSWYRRLLGHLAKIVIRLLAVPGIRDSQRGFKLFNQKAVQAIFPLQTIDRFGFDIELLAIARKQGLRIKELPVRWVNPAGSSVNLFSYLSTLKELFKIRLNMLNGKYG